MFFKEGDLINAYETTYQVDYNTGLYLQDNRCPVAMHAPIEPLQVTQQCSSSQLVMFQFQNFNFNIFHSVPIGIGIWNLN